MCLELPGWVNHAVKEAQSDIVCYKVLLKRRFHSDTFFSPFRNFPYKIGNTYTANLPMKPIYRNGSNKLFEKYMIHQGISGIGRIYEGIHTFVYEDDARNPIVYDNNRIVVKCRIPAGTKYYKGYFSFDASYASQSLILDEVIG